jgi:competence protein CoiA
MQYAVVNDVRVGAFKGGKGSCPQCSSPVVAKCGQRVIHHWAHAPKRDCDPWWENETPWHRAWKERFPETCREVSHLAPDGEVHRADVKTSTGIIVEFQNSSLSDQERRSREVFYGNIAWVVNGAAFRNNFYFLHKLPDPNAPMAADIVWMRLGPGSANSGMFWRKSENPNFQPGDMVEVHGLHKIEAELTQSYRGHHQYAWVKPRAGWLESGAPVYIDFGEDVLWRLGRYGDYALPCVQAVSKLKFVHDAMVEKLASEIASRFYPLRTAGTRAPGP